MNKRPNILLTNDDGIHAPGIRALWEAIAHDADVMIVAPSDDASGSGVGITLKNPLRKEAVNWPPKALQETQQETGEARAWKVSGKPADCVKLGLKAFLPEKPDLILSGINRGSNSGRTIFYSGTVGGVIEGALRQVPGIAFSCEDDVEPDYLALKPYLLPIIEHTLRHPLPSGTILNVNFPYASKPIQGIKLARQGRGFMNDNLDQRLHPTDGTHYFWLGGKWEHYEEPHDSDVTLLTQGYITAVPIHIEELTHHSHLKEHRTAFESSLNHLFKK